MGLVKLSDTIFEKVIEISAVLGAVILAGITLLVGTDVVMRYLLSRPIENVFEITEHSLVFITFLVAPWVLKKDQHVKMDGVLNQFSLRNRFLINSITSGLGTIICLILFVYGFIGTWDYFERDLVFPGGMRIKQYPILSIIVVSYFMLFLQFIRRTKSFYRKWRGFRNRG